MPSLERTETEIYLQTRKRVVKINLLLDEAA